MPRKRSKSTKGAKSAKAAEKPLRGSEIVFLAQRNGQIKQAAKIAEEAGALVTYITDISDMEKDDVAVWPSSMPLPKKCKGTLVSSDFIVDMKKTDFSGDFDISKYNLMGNRGATSNAEEEPPAKSKSSTKAKSSKKTTQGKTTKKAAAKKKAAPALESDSEVEITSESEGEFETGMGPGAGSDDDSDDDDNDDELVPVASPAATKRRGKAARSSKRGRPAKAKAASPEKLPVRRRRSAAKQMIDETPVDVEPRSRKPVETFSPGASESARKAPARRPRGVRGAPQKLQAPASAAASAPAPATSARSGAGADLPPPTAGRKRAGKAAYTQDELSIMVQWTHLCISSNEMVLKPRGNKMWHVARVLGLLTAHSQQSLWTKWKSMFHDESQYWLSRQWASSVPLGVPDGVGEFLREIQSATPIPTIQDAYELFLQGLPGWASLMNPKRGGKATGGSAGRRPRSPARKAKSASKAATAAASAEAARVAAEADAIESEDATQPEVADDEADDDLLPPAPTAARRAGRGASMSSPGRGKKRHRSADARAASALGKKARSAVASSPARSPKKSLSTDEVAATLAAEIGVSAQQAAGVLTATGGDYEMAATMLQVMVQKQR